MGGTPEKTFFPAFAVKGKAGKQLSQMVVKRANVFGNRHFIVVEDHQHIRANIAA